MDATVQSLIFAFVLFFIHIDVTLVELTFMKRFCRSSIIILGLCAALIL